MTTTTYILRKFPANHPNFAERANTSRLDQFVCHVEIIFKLFSLSLSKMVNPPFSPDVATISLAFMLRNGGNGNPGPTCNLMGPSYVPWTQIITNYFSAASKN